jgi:Ca2+-binding RTX toxin-like protein
MSKPSIISTSATTGRSVAIALAALFVGLAPSAVGHADDVTTTESGNRHHQTETCRGVPATHVNEDGTSGADVIVVTEPIDVSGWNGDDLICVKVPIRSYGAHVEGGGGDDTIITYSGENFIYGGEDDDSILSNSADHVLDGQDGNDTIYMGDQQDGYVYGGDGNDKIFGTPFSDGAHGGAGNDLMIGFAGNDFFDGGEGNDRLEGREGNDTLDGQTGDDTCTDAAAPATTFVSCETVVGFAVLQGPGDVQVG